MGWETHDGESGDGQSTTLYNAKKKGGKPAAKKKAAPRKQAAKGSALDAALAFAQEAGGLDQAEAALAKLREIKESL